MNNNSSKKLSFLKQHINRKNLKICLNHIYKLIDKVYERHGPSGLRSEVKYIVQYLTFLFNKLDSNSIFQDYILVTFYFRMYYRHYSQRKAIQTNQLSFSF